MASAVPAPKGAKKAPRRGAKGQATRAAILASARLAFTKVGYSGVGLRQIAAAAHVDVSMIGRYFGSKQQLFMEVLSEALDDAPLTAGPREGFGARMVEALMSEEPHPEMLDFFMLLVHASVSPDAAITIHQAVEEHVSAPLRRWLPGKDKKVRALAILLRTTGMALHMVTAGFGTLSPAERARLRRMVAAELQALVDG